MVIGFKKQFVEPIISGTKIHTVRSDEHDRWRSGVMMHMATGTRTKYYNCFKQTPCTSYQRVYMSYDWMLNISVGSRELFGANEREQFAINDGFVSLEAFEDWWYPVLAKNPNKEYSGKVIHWTNFRY
jgi:hypothetical protein